METATFDTPTATCGSCRAHIQEHFDDIDGVTEADLDLRSRRTTVVYDPAVLQRTEVASELVKAGYPIDD